VPSPCSVQVLVAGEVRRTTIRCIGLSHDGEPGDRSTLRVAT
jgi:hypothetical protein